MLVIDNIVARICKAAVDLEIQLLGLTANSLNKQCYDK